MYDKVRVRVCPRSGRVNVVKSLRPGRDGMMEAKESFNLERKCSRFTTLFDPL